MSNKKDSKFRPTEAMKSYAFWKAKYPEKTQRDCSKDLGVHEVTISKWKNQEGFTEWLDEKILQYRAPIHTKLEQVALEMLYDHRFWQDIGRKHGFIKDGEEDSTKKIEITYIEKNKDEIGSKEPE